MYCFHILPIQFNIKYKYNFTFLCFFLDFLLKNRVSCLLKISLRLRSQSLLLGFLCKNKLIFFFKCFFSGFPWSIVIFIKQVGIHGFCFFSELILSVVSCEIISVSSAGVVLWRLIEVFFAFLNDTVMIDRVLSLESRRIHF